MIFWVTWFRLKFNYVAITQITVYNCSIDKRSHTRTHTHQGTIIRNDTRAPSTGFSSISIAHRIHCYCCSKYMENRIRFSSILIPKTRSALEAYGKTSRKFTTNSHSQIHKTRKTTRKNRNTQSARRTKFFFDFCRSRKSLCFCCCLLCYHSLERAHAHQCTRKQRNATHELSK